MRVAHLRLVWAPSAPAALNVRRHAAAFAQSKAARHPCRAARTSRRRFATALPAAAPHSVAADQKPPPQNPYLIFNPIAGQEAPEAMLGAIALRLSARFPRLTVVQTRPDVHVEALAALALQQGADLVIASGGDGTITAVAGALRGSGVPLGIVPRGTANAFSVAFGIPTHLDDPYNFVERACDVIADGYAAVVDMALVTTSEVTDAPCLVLAGVGFEAEVVEGAGRQLKDAVGAAAYLMSGGAALLRQQGNFRAKVTVDGESHEGDIAALTVANAAPPTSVLAHGHVGDCIPDDGLLEVSGYVASDSVLQNIVGMAQLAAGVLFSDMALPAPAPAPSPAQRASAGGAEGGGGPPAGSDAAGGPVAPPGSGPVQDPERIFGGRYKEVTIYCDPPQKVVVDGELLGTTPLMARVQPASLRVLVPRPSPAAAPAAAAAGAEEDGGAEVAAAAAAGLAASAAVEPSFEALDRQGRQGAGPEEGRGDDDGPRSGLQ